jgi:hypothetical protein
VITEAEFQQQVCDLATLLGWSWGHFRPAKTQRGWRVPVSGPLGKGWPDLVLVRDDRLLFVELKRSGKLAPSPDQRFVLQLLGAAAETYVWTPDDIEHVAEVLGSARGFARVLRNITNVAEG